MQILFSENILKTEGFKGFVDTEFKILLPDTSMKEAGIKFLQYLFNYIEVYAHEILIGETFAYGCWLTKFIKAEDGYVAIGEYSPKEDKYTDNLHNSLLAWERQKEACESIDVDFVPPKPDQMVSISRGVFDTVLPFRGGQISIS